jgi:acyl-coenzyme A synthetase/AMP-(fatty) acid ligase
MNLDKDKVLALIEKLGTEIVDGYWTTETACIYDDGEVQIHITATKDEDLFLEKVQDVQASSPQPSHNADAIV